MRYVCPSVAMVVALSFAPPVAHGALNVSITNYQAVSERRATLTQWYLTFKADLVNTGGALPGITATVASRSKDVLVATGQGTLHFSQIPANGRATSSDTFTLLVDRSVPFDWSEVEWSFNNPVANAGANQTARVTGSVVLDGSASSNPSGTGSLSYNWTFQAVPGGSRTTLLHANTPSPSFVVDTPGTYQCQLTVTNGAGVDTATVLVSTVNSPPVAAAGANRTVPVGGSVTLNGSQSSDVDGDTLTYSWSFVSIPPKSNAVLLGARTVLPTFVADAAGSYIVQLIVNDGKADSQPSTVTISTSNTQPVANAGSNQTVVAGAFVQLNGSGSVDIDGDSLTYRWSFNSLPPDSAAALSGATVVNPTFTADKAGTYIVQLIVNDGKLDSQASTVTITTNAVQAPTAKAGNDLTVHAGTTVQLGGSGSDPQAFPLTYSWSLPTRPPNSTATLSATNIPNPTFVADLPGIYAAQLIVNNRVLSSPPSTVTITTTNTAPVADPGQPQSLYTGDTVYLDGSKSSDADNDPIVSYSWTLTSKPPSSTATLSGADTKTPTFVADVAGAYVAQLIVSDKYASSQAKTVLINVGARTITLSPNPLNLYNSPGTLNITLSPTPTSPVSIQLTAETPGVVAFSPNPATVPANSSGVNVTVTPISAGTTNITASAGGYYSSTGRVIVTKPTISIALNGGASAVAQTHKLGGTITLDAPAPPGGTSVTLSSVPAPDGAVTFASNPVQIAEGGTTAAFTLTGSQIGALTVTASAPGYNSARQNVQVVILGSVSLPSALTVGTGQSTPLRVQLSAPAPSDGLTVSLSSSDTSKVTVAPATVSIAAGATTPDPQPQVTGVARSTGDAIVTATAGGFYSDQQTIKVIAAITFKEQAVSVGPGGVKGFTILLSAPAPAGGLLVYLSSSNESVATTPPSGALVPAGQQTIDSQVTGVSVGTAEITLSTNPSIPGNQYFSGAGAVLSVTVARPAIHITTESLPAGITGAPYTATTLAATGGSGSSYFWTVATGSLPSGLNLNTSGVLSGTLSNSAVTSTFTVQVQDTGGNKDTKSFTITVSSPLTVTTDSLPAGVAGSSYTTTTLTASGGSGSGYTWSLASGALPAGLTLSTAGLISGDVSSSATSTTFSVQVQDSAGNTTVKTLAITIGARLAISTASVPAGTAGALYPTTSLEASGGSGGGYTWSLINNTSLPSGLILSAAGAISGTLSRSAVTTNFTVQVKDSGNNTATRQFTLTVNAALSITTTTLPNATTGADYPATTLSATGGSGSGYSWSVSVGALPTGLTLNSAGVLSGTVSNSASTSTFTIRVQDNGGAAATADFTITVYPALSVTTTSLPAGTAGSAYPAKFLAASGGSGIGYTWSLSTGLLPGGLTLSTGGVISGTLADSAKSSTFTVQVQDSAHNTATAQFTLTVNAALQIATSALPSGVGGVQYSSTTLAASGGSGNGYSWTVSAGSLPSGLTLSTSGVLSGTLAANATSSTFTVQVKDDAQNAATRQFTITVAVTITTTSLGPGDAGKSYSTLLTAAGGSGAPYTWSVSAGSLPSGLTLSAAGVLSGTISTSANSATFTIQAQDSANNTGSKQFTLTVNPALTITTGSLPSGTTGAAYPNTTLTASGGSNSGYTWSISSGTLPPNLTMSVGGVISGSLTTSAATATFTVQVQDGGGNTATKQFTLSVETVLAVVTNTLPDGVVGATYPSTALSAGGGSGTGYSWSLSAGSLPTGLTLAADGTISGAVGSSAQSASFTVQVKDSLNHTATKQLSITIHPALTITTVSLPTGTAGSAYPSTTLTATGGSGTGYTWSISTGSLPPNLGLSSDGVISGTISTSGNSSKPNICVRDSLNVTTCKEFTLTVNPVLVISTPSLPTGMATAGYPSTTLAATGGTGSGYTWSVSAGSLPAGLTLSTGGVLSGTLSSSAVTSIFTVQVRDNGSAVASKEYTLTVYPALTISTSPLPTGIAGNVYPNTILTASGGSGSGYSWSISSGTLPSGLTLSAGGVLSGTVSASATSANVTIQVQDGVGNKATQPFSITINPALSISTTSLPDGTAGTAYTPTTLAASGGTGNGYTWSVSAGPLPSGLTLSAAGVLSGTLSSAATSANVTIQVKDNGNNVATKPFTITIASGIGIVTALLPDGIAGAAYGPTPLTATGGTGTGYTWSIAAGSLPSGLTLSSGGSISGTLATNAVTATFTVKVKDNGNNATTRDFTLTVKPVLAINAATMPVGTAGSDYPSTTLTATGGTESGYFWSVYDGALPAGLTLSSGGVIAGTLGTGAVTSSFTAQVKDSGNNIARRQFTITVNPILQITTASLPAGTAGSGYTSTTLTATGGTSSGYTWSVFDGSLPAGLTLSPGGVLSGTLSNAATTQTFTLLVQDNGGNKGRKLFTLTVTLLVTTTTLPGGTAGASYTGATLTASGGTGAGYVWSLSNGSLPAGLTLSGGGVISGTLLTSATTSAFTVQVQDSGGSSATKQLSISVGAALAVTTDSLPIGTAGAAYPSTTLTASGGTGHGYTWSLNSGPLPTGLTLSADGVISGTLNTSATTALITVQVKDSGNNSALKTYTLTVNPVLTITTTTLPTGIAGKAYPSTNLVATGGTGSGYTWSLTAGSALPAGLTLNGGAISGTLDSAAKSSTFTVQVQDSGSNKVTKQLTLNVNPALSVTTTSLPSGMAGIAYTTTALTAAGGTASGYTWSIISGSLPTGLTLTGGSISGTLGSSAVTTNFTVQVEDSGGNKATQQLTITVVPALVITTGTLPSAMAGKAYPSTNLTATGGTGTGYTWSIVSGSLPAGLTLSSGAISGTLSSAAITQTFTVQVQDSGGNKLTKPLTITVYPLLTVATASLPDGLAGASYTSTTLSANGGTGTGYTWSVSGGALPGNLTLSSAGVLSGSLSDSATTANFTVQVQDSASNTATKDFTLTVVPLLSINNIQLPDGYPGNPYPSTTLTASGGSGSGYTFSVVSGALPGGLILSGAGAITGTVNPSAVTGNFRVQVKDSANHTAFRDFTITVGTALAVNASLLPIGVAGSPYPDTPLSATGGTGTGYTWSITANALPTGLTFSGAGVISGTLGASAVSTTFTVQVKDSAGNKATRDFTLTVNPAVSISTLTVPSGMIGAAYPSTTLSASGGTGTGYTWSVSSGSLPTGLTLSGNGALSGTPASTATTTTFTVKVQDSGSNSATKDYTLTIFPALTITTGALNAGTAGSVYPSVTFAATGGTGSGYAWSLSSGSLPTGLTLTSGGVLSGSLAYTAANSNFTIKVKDSVNNWTTKDFTITVNPGILAFITLPTLPNGTIGINYSAPIVAVGGTLPYTWSSSDLPSWLKLDTNGSVCGSAGSVCGVPPAIGLVTFTVKVTDSTSPTPQIITQQFSLTVTNVGGVGSITVSPVSVGVNLQTQTTITLAPPTTRVTILTIASGKPSAVLLGNSSEVGVGSLNVTLPANTSALQVWVKALADSSPVTLTASTDVDYTSGSGTATITKSGFVLAGPNGTGADFTTYQGVSTGITITPYRLGTNNILVEPQQIRGGLTVYCPISVAPTTLGTVTSPTVAFAGGDTSASTLFTASYTNTGTASLTVSPPIGSSFISPATGSTLNVGIQTSGFLLPSGFTVGRNLQKELVIKLSGTAGADTIVTIASSDANSLKFATSQTGAGTQSIQVVIKKGYSVTPSFFARAYGSSGSASYTVSASNFGTVTSSIPFGPSGFVINSPGGQGSDFGISLGSPDPSLDVLTALVNASGNLLELQSVAPDVNVTATVTSWTPSVGSVSPTSVQIAGGTYSNSFTFHALAAGSTDITATASGYSQGKVKATVGNVTVTLKQAGSVGEHLAVSGQVNLSSAATTSVPVTVNVTSGAIKLAVNPSDAGANSITVSVPRGSTNASFWIYGMASSGQGTYTATALGMTTAPDTVTLAPSGVAIYMGFSPTNFSCFGAGSIAPCYAPLSQGPKTVYAVTYRLLTDGTIIFDGGMQPLAGGAALSVPLNNSSPDIGTVPATVSIAGGASYGTFAFTPSKAGYTVISTGSLSGWTTPIYIGFDWSKLGITVQ